MTPNPIMLPAPFLDAILHGDVWRVLIDHKTPTVSLPVAPWLH